MILRKIEWPRIKPMTITALTEFDVENAAMNTSWPSYANEDISVLHATRRGWWNSGNGSVKKCSMLYRTVISFSANPKILSRYFLYDRRLLSELSRCAWDSLKVFFQTIVPEEDAVPDAVIAIQTFGDFLGFNPHCHVLCTDGGFYGKGMFRVAPWFIPRDLEKLFRYKVFKMLLSRKKITEDLIDMMMGWRHSGFMALC